MKGHLEELLMFGRSMTKDEIIEKLKEENKTLQDKLDKIKEYLTSYNSICTIQYGQEDDNANLNSGLEEKTMTEMTHRYLKVHNKILSIIESESE
jgi:hypothetical protein